MIAIVYPQFYGVGEIVRYLDSFLANLPDNHVKVYLITGDKNRRIARYKGVEIINVPFTSNRFSLILWTLRVRKLLIQLHKQKKVQWLNLHVPPLIPGLLLPKNIPMLLTVHSTYLGMSGDFYKTRYFDSHWNIIEIQIKRWMESYIFRQAKRVVVLNAQGKQEVLAYGYQKQINVVPSGLDLSHFRPNPSVAKDIDVVFCGGIDRHKGSRVMVALCKTLIAKNPDITICIVGYGEDEDWVRNNLSSDEKNITLSGKATLEEIISFYQRSRVFASTSYYEGLTSTCIKAMAMALPVVVWDLLFYRNLVINNVTGILVPVDNIEQMALQITKLITDESENRLLANQARNLIEKSYSWDTLSKQVLATFN